MVRTQGNQEAIPPHQDRSNAWAVLGSDRPRGSAHLLRTGAVAAVVGIMACGDGSTDGAPDLDSLPVLSVTEELRLGDVDDPDLGFSRVGHVDVDRDGNLYVLELLDRGIRVFDRDGIRLRTIGGPGEGPGEFGRSPSFGVMGDTVWALDMSLRRITLFDREGQVLSTGRMEGVPVALQNPRQEGVVWPRGMRPDGMFTGDMTMFRSRRDADATGVGPRDTVQVPRVLFDPSGEVVDTIAWDRYPPPEHPEPEWVERGPTRYYVPPWPGDKPLELNEPSGRWVVERARAEQGEAPFIRILRLSEPGDTIYSRVFTYTPKPYSAEVLDSIAWRSARIPGGSYSTVTGPRPTPPGVDINDVHGAIRAAMNFPEFQTGVERPLAGKDGTLWLLREDSGGPLRRWLIVKPDGSLRGHLDIPRRWQVRWVSAERFVVSENDEFDVPWVVRLRIGP